MTTSFLQTASARIVDTASTITDCPLQLVLVDNDEPNNNDGIGRLSHSLAMDVAYSLVSNSLTPCRGCNNSDSNDMNTNTDGGGACQCCKVAILMFGNPKQSKKQRRSDSSTNDSSRIEFPMLCTSNEGNNTQQYIPNLLQHIQIKYVTSITEVVKYLAYAPSLPNHLQPLDGIFVLGMGNLLSSGQNISMELTHLLSVLSDTADALGDNKRELLQSKTSDESRSDDESKYSDNSVSVLVTIDKHTFSTLPQRVTNYLHQYNMAYIATIMTSRSDSMTFDNDHEDMTSSSNEYKLAIKDTLDTKGDVSFGFKVDQEELVWNV